MARAISGGVAVEGLAQLTKTFNHAPADVKKAYKAELRSVAEPTRSTAERLATERIRRNTVAWSKMRTGVTQREVYVAPRARGVKTRGRDRLRRPKFGTLLAQRATQPALKQNEPQVEKQFSDMLDRLVHKWDSEGHRARGVTR